MIPLQVNVADPPNCFGKLFGYVVPLQLSVADVLTAALENLMGLCGSFSGECGSELRSYVKVEVAVLGFLSLIVRKVSVDIKQYYT